LLGYLMYRSGLVPRRMALLGLIGGPLIFASSTAILSGAYEQTGGMHFILSIPEIAWQAACGGHRPRGAVPASDQARPPDGPPRP
jgi:hypothetical protein